MHQHQTENLDALPPFVVIYRGLSTLQAQTATEHLLDVGFTAFEVSLTSENAVNTIESLSEEFGEVATIGAGTVRTTSQVHAVSDAGARLLLSPETDATVISESKSLGMFTVPGAFSPTEVSQAHKYGADLVKLFPAAGVGFEYFRLLREPFPEIPFLVTGGVTSEDAKEYFKMGAKSIGVGVGLLANSAVATGDWAALKAGASRYLNTASEGMQMADPH